MNIHENISRLRSLYDRDLEAAEEGRKGTYDTEKHRLISKIFTDLVKNPGLSSEETVFVKKVYEDLSSISLRQYPYLAMRISAYQRTLVSPIEPSDSSDALSQMTPEEILHASGLSVYITDPEKQRFFCHFLKKGFREQEALPLSYLGLTEIPSVFFTEPFFASLRLDLSERNTLPDIPIAQVRNPGIVEQYLKQHVGTKESPKNIAQVPALREIGKGKNPLSHYVLYRDKAELVENKYYSGGWTDLVPPQFLSREECERKAREIHEDNQRFLANERRYGRLSFDPAETFMGLLQTQEIAQDIRNHRLLNFFPLIFSQLPHDLQNRWRGDFRNVFDIRDFLYRERDTIEKIPYLNLSCNFLRALPEEIEVFSGLESVDLSQNLLTDLTPLSRTAFPNLSTLFLSNNSIQDLSPLRNLPKLRNLFASNIEISDISAVSSLTELEIVNLADNQISDLSPISFLTKLKNLNLSNNLIENLQDIRYLKETLTSLFVAKNRITSLSGVQALSKLSCLDISENSLFEIHLLENLKELTSLNASYNLIEKINSLQNCKKLEMLVISGNNIENIEFVRNFSSTIKHIEMENNKIEDIFYLSTCENLEFVSLQNNIVTDVSPLFPLSSLETLVFTPQKEEVPPELTQENLNALHRHLPNLQIF